MAPGEIRNIQTDERKNGANEKMIAPPTATTPPSLEYRTSVESAHGFSAETFRGWICGAPPPPLADRIAIAFQAVEIEENEPRPSDPAISTLVELVREVSKTEALSDATVSAFYGEAILTWKVDCREITLLARGAEDDPKLLRYEFRDGRPSYHRFRPQASPEHLKRAVRWLYE
jgi:hypothetical protein